MEFAADKKLKSMTKFLNEVHYSRTSTSEVTSLVPHITTIAGFLDLYPSFMSIVIQPF